MVMLIIKIMFDELGLFWLIERDNFHTARASSKKKKKEKKVFGCLWLPPQNIKWESGFVKNKRTKLSIIGAYMMM